MRKFSPDDQRAAWSIKPRNCTDLHTPAEAAIRAAIDEVEKSGAHPMLTETVILLGRALDTIGAYVDDVESDNACQTPR